MLWTNNLPCDIKDASPFDKIWSLVKRNTATSTFAFTGVGSSTWTDAGIGTPTKSYVQSTSTEGAYYKQVSPATTSNAVIFNDTAAKIEVNSFSMVQFKLNLFQTTNVRIWIGLMDAGDGGTSGTLQTSTPTNNLIAFRYAVASDSNWKAYAGTDASHQTVVDPGSGGGADVDGSGASHVYTITQNPAGQFNFFVDGKCITSVSANIPAGTTKMAPFAYVEARSNSAVGLGWTWSYWEELR